MLSSPFLSVVSSSRSLSFRSEQVLGANGYPNGSATDYYYSFTHGRTHFLATTTEATPASSMFFNKNSAQYAFIEADLAKAAEDRAAGKISWIVAMGHKPIYCSYNWSSCCWDACDTDDSSQWVNQYALNIEPLFLKYGVDLWLNGHTHNYERSFPGRWEGTLCCGLVNILSLLAAT